MLHCVPGGFFYVWYVWNFLQTLCEDFKKHQILLQKTARRSDPNSSNPESFDKHRQSD